jgi:hypothetical protein
MTDALTDALLGAENGIQTIDCAAWRHNHDGARRSGEIVGRERR